MREIKFRVWNKVTREMLDVVAMTLYPIDHLVDNILVYKQPHVYDEYLHIHFLDEIEPMQYTGLKDKNGKEIYEGDIVKIIKGNEVIFGKVVYIPEEASYCVQAKGYETFPIGLLNAFFDIEVVGNIYQNPELLEV